MVMSFPVSYIYWRIPRLPLGYYYVPRLPTTLPPPPNMAYHVAINLTSHSSPALQTA